LVASCAQGALFVRLLSLALLHSECLGAFFALSARIAAHKAGAGRGRCSCSSDAAGRYPFEFVPPPFALAQAFAVAYFKSFAVYHVHPLPALWVLRVFLWSTLSHNSVTLNDQEEC